MRWRLVDRFALKRRDERGVMKQVLVTTVALVMLQSGLLHGQTSPTAGSILERRGELALQVQSTSGSGAKRIAADFRSADTAQIVSGTAEIHGFPFIKDVSENDIDWKVDGTAVSGTITGKDGRLLGSFQGTINTSGMTGTFTHVDGRVGQWSWDGPAPVTSP